MLTEAVYQSEGSAGNLVGRAGKNRWSSSKDLPICGPRKVKIKVKFTLEQDTKVQRGSILIP
jgi:hypothetical protein